LKHTPTRRSIEVGEWKQPLGGACAHGLAIMLVDGTYVRNHYDSDFSQGGNGFRYRFVSRREIWVDKQISEIEWPFIIMHECYEAELMREGQTYDRAHDTAKRLEDKCRRLYFQKQYH
jgi:hypothetical protein